MHHLPLRFSFAAMLICFLMQIQSGLAQAPLVKMWDKRFGGTDTEILWSVIPISSGGFLLGGYSTSDSSGNIINLSHGNADFYIVKIDNNGNLEWNWLYGGNSNEAIFSMLETKDGGFLLGGSTSSDSSGDVSHFSKGGSDCWLLKIDSLGIIQWNKLYGGNSSESITSISETNDNGYILGCWTVSDSSGDVTNHNHGSYDSWIIKIDSIGNIQWNKLFGGIQFETRTKIFQTSDNGYFLCTYSTSDSSGNITAHNNGGDDCLVIKTDSLGNMVWNKYFGGAGDEWFSEIYPTENNGLIIGAWSSSDSSGSVSQNNHGFSDFWVIKIDSSGNKI